MTARWLAPVTAALDARESSLDVYFRNDDAGWDTPALEALLNVFSSAAMPIDVAVIPAALDAPTAAMLRRRHANQPLGLHQHGHAHVNHQLEGRKAEFGDARTEDAQAQDIARGAERLADLLGACPDPIFTPPWNRCAPATVGALVRNGFRALSRDSGAAELDLGPLASVPVHVDWLHARHGFAADPPGFGSGLAERFAGSTAVGVMLHHAATDAAGLEAVSALAQLLAKHANARGVAMASLLPA